MSDKTELLIVKVEKRPILYDKGCRDFKDPEKNKNAWKPFAQGVGLTHCNSHSPNYRVLYERWFVRTFERKVAMVAFVDVLCINRPQSFPVRVSLHLNSLLRHLYSLFASGFIPIKVTCVVTVNHIAIRA